MKFNAYLGEKCLIVFTAESLPASVTELFQITACKTTGLGGSSSKREFLVLWLEIVVFLTFQERREPSDGYCKYNGQSWLCASGSKDPPSKKRCTKEFTLFSTRVTTLTLDCSASFLTAATELISGIKTVE
jgi:hypothetical protein